MIGSMESAPAQHWHLTTRHTQLTLRCTPEGKLMLTYLGARLAQADDALIDPPCEFPLIPTDFDALSRWGNYSEEYALHLRLPDGTTGWNLLLCTPISQADENTLCATLADPRWPGISVQCHIECAPEEDTYTLRTRLCNQTDCSLQVLRAASAAISLHAAGYHLTTFRGSWAGEHYLQQQHIAPGNAVCISSSTGIKTAQEGMPAFLLGLGAPPTDEENGLCLLGALAWSGNYHMQFKRSIYGHIQLTLGHHFAHSPYLLQPEQELQLPPAILTLSTRGAGHASRCLHRHMRRRIIPHGEETRRSLLNSWEGVHFDVDEQTICRLISATAELGAEMFVLDDGWFGKRDDDTSSLGDWTPDTRKLPHGLTPLIEHAHTCGIDFGIWVEPEMVCPVSNLYAQDSSAALHLQGIPPRTERHQLVLDVPATDISAPIHRLLAENPGISYVKWDCNRKISDPGSAHRPPELQGNLSFDYIRSYYGHMRALRAQHPRVTFQCCSAGGGRMDAGAAALHEEFWLSDNTDPHDRLRMQWAASYIFPANAIGCHVTASPNLYTGRTTSTKFRFDVALAGRLGLELDPRTLSPADRAEYQERIALAHHLRPLTQLGELYRLVSPYEGSDCALLYTDGTQALLLAYTTQRSYTDQHTRIPLRGISPDTRYRITELLPDTTGYHCPLHEQTLGGDYLLANGIPIRWNRPHQSCVILLSPAF